MVMLNKVWAIALLVVRYKCQNRRVEYFDFSRYNLELIMK